MFNIILNQLKETKELVAMYNNKYDSSAFFVGVIIDTDEYYTHLSTVSPSALYDGHVVIKNEDIHKIELRSRYIKKIDFLLKDNKVKFDFSCCNKSRL